MFIMLSVLEVTQRVPPTCIIKTDFTHRQVQPFRVPKHALALVLLGLVDVQHGGLVLTDPKKSKKALVLIILVIVFKHKFKI